MSEVIRSFIAIELDDKTHQLLSEIQNKLKHATSNIKWVNSCNIHLTLKFLGNIQLEKIEEVKSLLDDAALGVKAFKISLSEIGAFPKLDYVRVIWVGIKLGSEKIKSLASNLEEKLTKLGFEKEKRPFRSHLTLGRMRLPKPNQELKLAIESLNTNELTSFKHQLTINHITLFQSTLTPKGSIYTPLHKTNLATT